MFLQLLRCIRVIFVYQSETLGTAQIIHDLFRRSVELILFKGIYFRLSVHIGFETVQGKICCVKGILPVLIHHNMKGGVQGLAVGFQDLHQGIGHIVESQIFLPVGVIASVVFQYNGIGQLVVGQKLAVAVPDISAGAFYSTCFCGAQIKIVGVLVAFYDLKFEKMLYQDKKHKDKYQKQHGSSFDT